MPEIQRAFYTTFSHEYDNLATEEVACNYCGSTEYRRMGTEGVFEIRRCKGCGLVYVGPQPTAESLPRFYEGMYADTSETEAASRNLGPVEKHIRRIVMRRKPGGGEFCDIGHGFGRLLMSMKDTPFTLHGVEVSEAAQAYVREALPEATLSLGTAETIEFAPESFDCITLIAVYEHVKDPTRVIENLYKWLKPGGLLIIQVPYIQHFFRISQAVPMAPRVPFEAPRHLFDFSPVTLPRFFEKAGFTGIEREVARPYCSNTSLEAAAIWAVKLPGIALWALTGKRYIYPFAAAITVHGMKPSG